MAKKGYVTRQVIEAAIANHLVACGKTLQDATSKSRNYISDFKKDVDDQIRLIIILNEGDREREQYRCQDLGEWLYKRRSPLKEFRTPVCDFNATFDVSVHESLEVNAIAIQLSEDELNNPEALLAKLMQQGIDNERMLAKLNEKVSQHEKQAVKTKALRHQAGKEGGRGRPKY
jgi:hypothetical protein